MDIQSIAAGSNPVSSPERVQQQKLKAMAQEFEAILIAAMLKEAQPHTQADPVTGGRSHDLYQQLFTDEIAKAIARSGGIGVGKMLERQLQRQLHKTLPTDTPSVNASSPHENSLKILPERTDLTNRSGIPLMDGEINPGMPYSLNLQPSAVPKTDR